MDYEQKYKDALNWMRSIYPTMQGADREDAEHHFPELKESEDERIRKELLEHCINRRDGKQICVDASDYRRWAAWLEKQGEQKSIEYPLCKTVKDKIDYYIVNHFTTDTVVKTDVNSIVKAMEEGVRIGMREKEPADKGEPKFKICDWITNGEYTWKVTDIKPLDYILQSQNGDIVNDTISYVDEEFHLWTLQDAKKGNILQANKCTLIFDSLTKDIDGNTVISSWYHCDTKKFYGMGPSQSDLWTIEGVVPATKEQRDLLFQKMKEAGYEWDVEKKELKKIEQKPSWSEEDEKLTDFEKQLGVYIYFPRLSSGFNMEEKNYIRDAANTLINLARKEIEKENPYSRNQKQEWSEEDELVLKQLIYVCHQNGWTTVEEWLKSLKPNHWKPSEEQMQALFEAKLASIKNREYFLGLLYEDLKKL